MKPKINIKRYVTTNSSENTENAGGKHVYPCGQVCTVLVSCQCAMPILGVGSRAITKASMSVQFAKAEQGIV